MLASAGGGHRAIKHSHLALRKLSVTRVCACDPENRQRPQSGSNLFGLDLFVTAARLKQINDHESNSTGDRRVSILGLARNHPVLSGASAVRLRDRV